jgi:hypothetical protein
MADPYFTVDELRAADPKLTDDTKYPDENLEEARDYAEQAIEDAAHVAFVPRTATERISGLGVQNVYAAHYRVREVTELVIDGTTVTDLSTTKVAGSRRLWRQEGWPLGIVNVELTYEHGHDAPPKRIKAAALTLAKAYLLKGPLDDRVTRIISPATGDTEVLAVPGRGGSEFGIPEIDAAIARYREPQPDLRL